MNNTGNIRAQEVPALRCGRRSGEDLVMEEGCNMTACFFFMHLPGLHFHVNKCSASAAVWGAHEEQCKALKEKM